MTGLWQALNQAGLTEPQLGQDDAAPLWLLILSGIAGWFAAMCFLGFSVALMESIIGFESGNALVIGLLYALLARFIYRRAAGREFMLQLGFAINLAAMTAMLWGLMELLDGKEQHLYLSGFIILSINGFFVSYRTDALLSVWGALVMLGLGFESLHWQEWLMPLLLALLVLLSLPAFSVQLSGAVMALMRRWRQVLLLGLLLLPWLLDGAMTQWHGGVFDGTGTLLGPDGTVSLLMLTELGLFALLSFAGVFGAAQAARLDSAWLLGMASALVLTLLYSWFPALAVALALWVHGWNRRERKEVALCLLAAVASFSVYYYQLSLTLLAKSLVLILLGVLLMALGAVCKRRAV